MHWNGTAWKIVSSPNLGNHENFLNGITVVSTSDVWAVGHYESSSTGQYLTLVEHWNGTAWKVVGSSNIGGSTNKLYGVTALSATNIWAVGYSHIALALLNGP